MPKLTVEATHGSYDVKDVSVGPLTLCVSVSDDSGRPVGGLKAARFTVATLDGPIVGGEEVAPSVVRGDVVEDMILPGFYKVKITPLISWQAGRYVVSVAVKKTTVSDLTRRRRTTVHIGQTLVGFGVSRA